jgi:hypothetical protein
MPEGLGKMPLGKGVRTESGMDDAKRTGKIGIGKIGEIVRHLFSSQHPFVDHHRVAQTADIEPSGSKFLLLPHPLFDAPSQYEQFPLQSFIGFHRSGKEYLTNGGFGLRGKSAEDGRIDRYAAPSKHRKTRLCSQHLHHFDTS